MNILKVFFPLCLLIFSGTGECQTIIRGKVTDATTFEPVVYANVVFKGTAIGAKTGFDGMFSLEGVTESDSVVISFIGYETRTIFVLPGSTVNLDIMLLPATYSISEVLVRPGENPAHRILRKAWQNREKNSIGKNEPFQYDNYSRLTVYFRKFRNESERRGFYDKEFGKFGIKTGEEKITAIPAFINETFSTTYFQVSPERTCTEIKAISKSGLAFDKTDLVAQLVLKQENLDLSGNNVLIADKNFISPLSRSGPLYYKYYLTDSLFIDRYYCYEISIVPKREEDPVFRGTMWINDSTFALKRISVEVSGKAEINFIQRIKIQQEYEPMTNGSWFPVRTRFMADAVNIFFSNYSGKSNFEFNKPVDPGFFSSELKIDTGKIYADRNFWEKTRTSTLDRNDSLAISRIDSLRKDRKIRISAKLVEASVRNYYDFGSFEAGPLVMIYNFNPAEGSRIRAGGRTTTDFSRRLYLEGYLAYGTRDNRFKGSLKSELFLSKKRWAKIGVQFSDDIEKTGAADDFFSGDSFLSFASSFGGWDKLNRSVTTRAWIESDVFKGLNARLFMSRKSFDPLSPDHVFAWYADPRRNTFSENFVSGEIGMSLRFQPAAVYVVDGLRRFPVNFNKFPVFELSWIKGKKSLFGGDFDLDRITTGISDNFSIGGLGRINFDLSYSKVYGQLPYPLLINAPANESVFYSGRLFNLMNYGEFVADEAFQAFTEYHMDGLIMNRIPLVKKLHLRTVVSASMFSGSFNTGSFRRPYSEVSYGMENIFRFIRVDLVQRLSWLHNPEARRFAVKFSGVFRF